MPSIAARVRDLFNTRANWPQLALGLSFVQAVIVSALEAGLIGTVLRVLNSAFTIETNGNVSFVVVYISLFLFAIWFQAILAVEGFYHKNSIQVISVSLLHLSTFMYSAVQAYQIKSIQNCVQQYADIVNSDLTAGPSKLYKDIYNFEHDANTICHFSSVVFNNDTQTYSPTVSSMPPEAILPRILTERSNLTTALALSYTIIFVMVVCYLIGLFLSYKTFGVYGWSIYNKQGADITKREILRRYHIFMAIMKINAYFFLAIVAQGIMSLYYYNKLQQTTEQSNTSLFDRLHHDRITMTWFSAIVIVIALIYFMLGYLGMRHENFWAMGVFIFMVTIYMVLIIGGISIIQTTDMFAVTKNFLTLFAVIQLLLNVATLVSAVLAMLDFRKGLGQIVLLT
eukprot:jgi/Hompol1/1465/HPOL_002712-RA